MRFRCFISSVFIALILLIQVVLSDTVEITIEYETTTTTTIPGVTTTITGDGSGSSATTTTINLPEETVPEAELTYSMPASYKVYQNETGSVTISIKNTGTVTLHNVVIAISGIPSYSYSISPTRTDTLEPGKSAYMSVSINPQNITPGIHSLSVMIVSDETYETAYLSLDVKEYTREIGKKIEEQEEFEKEVKPTLISINSILIGIVLTSSIIAAIMLMRLRVNRCPLCGGSLEKEYEGDNFISYKCSKCSYYKTKVKK